MADQKITDLTEDTNPGNDSLVYAVDDPAGTPLDRKVSLLNLNRGLILLDEQEANGSASLDFTSLQNTVFDEWLLELNHIVPATDGAQSTLLMSTDGGSSYDSGANYGYVKTYFYPSSNSTTGANTGESSIHIGVTIENTAAYGGMDATIRLFGLGTAGTRKRLFYDAFTWANDAKIYRSVGTGIYHETSNDVDAFQIIMSSGNITSGIARLYGMRK